MKALEDRSIVSICLHQTRALTFRMIYGAYSETPIERNAMFNRRALQVQMVKTNKQSTPTDVPQVSKPRVTPEQILKIAKENMKPVIISLFVGVAALKVVDAGCEIAVNAAPKR